MGGKVGLGEGVGNFCPTQAGWGAGCGMLFMLRLRNMQVQSLFEPVLTPCSKFSLVTCHTWRI